MFVDDLRTTMLVRLPDGERRPFRVGDHGHASGVHDVERVGRRAAGSAGLCGDLVGAVDPYVRVPPRRRLAVGGGSDPGNVATPNSTDEVLAFGPFRHRVLDLPTEQVAVELRLGLRVGRTDVDPARHALDVTASLGHGDHSNLPLVRRHSRAYATEPATF